MFEVTFLPILVAAVANLILGFIWFHPKTLGTAWMAGAGISPSQAEAGRKQMPMMAGIGVIASMVTAYVMNYFGIAWGVFDWIGAVELGFWCWVGFAAPILLGSVLWERKSLKYYVITSGYWLVGLILMAVVLVQMA